MDGTRARPVSPGWRRVVDRSAMVCGVFVFTVQVAVCTGALVSIAPDADVRTTGAVAVTLGVDLVLLAMSAVGVARPERLRGTGIALPASAVAMTGVCVAATIRTPPAGPPLEIVAVNAAQAAQAVALGLVLRPALSAALVVATGVVFVPLRVAAAGASVPEAVDQWILPAAVSLGVLAVLRRLRDQADEADALARAAETEREAQAARQNRELARDEARRLVHDDVISALRAIELRVGGAAEQRAAAGALASLGGTTRLSTRAAFEDGLRSAARLDVVLDADRWQHPPPPRVLGAMGGAAAEALRNAERHGGAATASVRLASDELRTVVEVHDDGRGMADDWRPGFGVSESIVGRMRSVGGEASVGPDATGAAVVRLTWPEPEHPVRTTAGELGLAPLAVLWPLAAACSVSTTYLAVRFPGSDPVAGWLVALAVLALLAVVAQGLGRLRAAGRAASGPAVAAVGSAVCALTWLGLLAAGDGALLSVRSWVVGAAANVVALLAFEARARQVVPIVGAQVLVVLAAAARDPGVGLVEPIGALATPVVVGGVGLVLGIALRHGERRVRRARADLGRSREVATWAESDQQSRRVHLGHLEDDVVPYLRRVADGEDADATEASLLALGCRDALYLDRPLDAATRASVRAARRSGLVVTIRAGAHEPDAAWPLLRRLLATAPPGARITVVPPDATRPSTAGRIVVVPALPADHPLRLDGVGAHDAVRSAFSAVAALSTEETTDA